MVIKDDGKYKNFVFTWLENAQGELPYELDLTQFLHEKTADYAFQREKGEITNRVHYQGCLQCTYRMRKRTILKEFDSWFGEKYIKYLTISPMMGKWENSLAYCSKKETSSGPIFASPKQSIYTGEDLELFEDESRWHKWQKRLQKVLYTQFPIVHYPAHARQIHWVMDVLGASGKSKYVKYICYKDKYACKIAFGSANQMRSSIIARGPMKIYFIDIPRTLGQDDDMDAVISVIEDVKNGFVTSAMYGKSETLMFNTPHIVIFSNLACPTHKLSRDRWISSYIDRDDLDLNTY